MLIQSQVGPVASTQSISAGVQSPLRAGNMGDVIMSELHGRYYENAYRRNLFTAASTAAVATVALGTTASYTGLYLANPIGSTVNIVLLKATWAASVAVPTAGYVVLEAGYSGATNVTAGGAITPSNNFVGVGAAGQALAGAGSATLPIAPVAKAFLSSTGSVATTSTGIQPMGIIDLEGSLILPPGGFAAFATFATNTAAWWFSFSWEEVPV